MSDRENDPAEALKMQDPGFLARENATLRAQLEQMQKANVVAGRFAGEVPRYQLNEAGFYDDTFFEPGSVIEFTDTPNLTMVPLNDPAKRAMAALIEHLEDGARAKAGQAGRQYTGLVTDRGVLIDFARQDAQAAERAPVPVIQVPVPQNNVPAMPHTLEAQAQKRRGRPATATIVAPPAPQKPDAGAPQLAQTRDPSAERPDAVVGRMVSR